jgi:hypothetical protein
MQRRPHRSSLGWRGLRGCRVLHPKWILFFIKTEYPYQGCYDCAKNGCDGKEPKLGEAFFGGIIGPTDTARFS